jgi:hypothetical protein
MRTVANKDENEPTTFDFRVEIKNNFVNPGISVIFAA